MEYDVLVRNGVVVDGSGAARFRADVAIKDRKIAALIDPADAASASAPREIDATGLAIAPGFIDLHSHSDWVLPIADHGQILKPFLLQGVTTFVGGNCGFSVAPVMRERQRMLDESGRSVRRAQVRLGMGRRRGLRDVSQAAGTRAQRRASGGAWEYSPQRDGFELGRAVGGAVTRDECDGRARDG